MAKAAEVGSEAFTALGLLKLVHCWGQDGLKVGNLEGE